MEFGDAPDMVGNVAGGSIQGTPLQRPADHRTSRRETRELLRLFVLSGHTKKTTAALLFSFCCTEKGAWLPHDNGNNAAPPSYASPTESLGMSASSSRSSQHPPTQPQTPDADHHPSLAQHYVLDQLQQPQDDYVDLRTFLLWLLAPASGLITLQQKANVQALFNMSSLPGHGTQPAFHALDMEAVGLEAPIITSFDYFHPSPTYQQHTPSFHAQSPTGSQDQFFQDFQQSPSRQHGPYDVNIHVAHVPSYVPSLDLLDQQQSAYMQNDPLSPIIAQRRPSLAPPSHSPLDNSLASPFNPGQFPPQQGSNVATSPVVGPSPLKKPRKNRGRAATAHVSPDPPKNTPPANGDTKVSQQVVVLCKLKGKDGKPCYKACSSEDAKNAEGNACKFLIEHVHRVHPDHYIANLPSNRKSLDDMFNVQIARCTILADGQPCDWTLASEKPWRAAFEHIKECHPEDFVIGLDPNENCFDALVRGDEPMRCPVLMPDDSGKQCPKHTIGKVASRSMVEHMRRAHFKGEANWRPLVMKIKAKYPHLASKDSVVSTKETIDALCEIMRDESTVPTGTNTQEVHRISGVKESQAPPTEPSKSRSPLANKPLQQTGLPQHASIRTPETTDPPPQQVQHFDHKALQYDPRATQCLPPSILQIDQPNSMYPTNYHPHVDTSFLDTQMPGDLDTTTLGFPMDVGVQARLVNMGMTMPDAAAYNGSRLLNQTLVPPLFPPQTPESAEPLQHERLYGGGTTFLQQPSNDQYQQPHQATAFTRQAELGMANSLSSFTPEAFTGSAECAEQPKKRERQETEDDGEDQQEPLSKRASTRPVQMSFAMSPSPAANRIPMGDQTSPNGLLLGQSAVSFASPPVDNATFYDIENQSVFAAPPVDGVDSAGLAAFDFGPLNMTGDGAPSAEESFKNALYDGTHYNE